MKRCDIQIPRTADPTDGLDSLEIRYGPDIFVGRSLKERGLRGWQPATTATLLAAWEFRPSAFFDVGANIGIYALLHSRIWPASSTVAFEPTPDVASHGMAITRANRAAIQWETAAVSHSDGEATLYRSSRSDASNSLVAGHRRPAGTVTVSTVTLDSFVRRSGVVPSVIKIDVERHERAVIRGAAELLTEHKPVIVAELLPGRADSDETRRLLAEHGYEGRLIEPAPGSAASGELRDWLFWPGSIPDRFGSRFFAWSAAVARCTPI